MLTTLDLTQRLHLEGDHDGDAYLAGNVTILRRTEELTVLEMVSFPRSASMAQGVI